MNLRGPNSKQIGAFLMERPKEVFSYDELARRLPNLTRGQIASTCWTLANRSNGKFEKLGGSAIRYNPDLRDHRLPELNPRIVANSQPISTTLFECLKELENDRFILKDENGDLYIAKKLR